MYIVRADGDRYQLNTADEGNILLRDPPFLPKGEHADFVRYAIGMADLLGTGMTLVGVRKISDEEIHILSEFFEAPIVKSMISGESEVEQDEGTPGYDNWGNW